jgi:sulfonate transport system substrate-binding protein
MATVRLWSDPAADTDLAVKAYSRQSCSRTAAAVAELAPSIGIPALVLALARQGFGVGPLTDEVIADQQLVADTFHGLGLLPKEIVVADAVRRSGL